MGTILFVSTGEGVRSTQDLSEVPKLLAEGTPFWIDATEIDDPLKAVMLDQLKLHPLAVEDISQERMAPKIEEYDDYLYVVIHGIHCPNTDPAHLETIELDLVISERWVFSHHPAEFSASEKLREEITRSPRLMAKGTSFLAHGILDRVVDHYVAVVEKFDGVIEEVEHAAHRGRSDAVVGRIFSLKRALQKLRRTATHQREVLLRLSRGEFDLVSEKALPFYRDVHDHFVRVADLTESYRELLSAALESYRSTVANRMNEVMKTLTLVSTLMLPLTFIAGVYGMNFDQMPELHWAFGYPFALGLMGAVALGMLLWFRHKRWW